MDTIRILFIDDVPALRLQAKSEIERWMTQRPFGSSTHIEMRTDEGVNPDLSWCHLAVVDEYLGGGVSGTGLLRRLDPERQAGILISHNPDSVPMLLGRDFVRDVGTRHGLSLLKRVIAIPKALSDQGGALQPSDWWRMVLLPAAQWLLEPLLLNWRTGKYLADTLNLGDWTSVDTRWNIASKLNWHGLITSGAPAMTLLIEYLDIDRLAPSNIMLLIGDSGVGKDCAAFALHTSRGKGVNEWFPVAEGPPPEMLTRLFGTCVGGWTDSKVESLGMVELAARCGGTVFVNEVGPALHEIASRLHFLADYKQITKYHGADHTHHNSTLLKSSGYTAYYGEQRNNHLAPITLPDTFWVVLATTRRNLPTPLTRRFVTREIPSLTTRLGDIVALTHFFVTREASWLSRIDEACYKFLLGLPWASISGNVGTLLKLVKAATLRAKALEHDQLREEHVAWAVQGEPLLGVAITKEVEPESASTAEKYWNLYGFGGTFRAWQHYGSNGRWATGFAKDIDRDAMRLCVLRRWRELRELTAVALDWGVIRNDDARMHASQRMWIDRRRSELISLPENVVLEVARDYLLVPSIDSAHLDHASLVNQVLECEKQEPQRFAAFRQWVYREEGCGLGLTDKEVNSEETTNALVAAFLGWTESVTVECGDSSECN